jgi:hypothetical protein
VLAQQRYAKSHRIFANCRGVKDFRRFRNSQDGTLLVGRFWGLDSDRVLKLVLREIILSQNGSPRGVYRMHRFRLIPFGLNDPNTELFKQLLPTVERVVNYRNAVEHPEGYSGTLQIRNFRLDPQWEFL